MKIEIDKNDFVKLAVYASCAYLPAEEENKCEMTLRKVMDSFDKEDANGNNRRYPCLEDQNRTA